MRVSTTILSSTRLSLGLMREICAVKDRDVGLLELQQHVRENHAKMVDILKRHHGPLAAVGVFAECDECVNYDYCLAADLIRSWDAEQKHLAERPRDSDAQNAGRVVHKKGTR